MRFFQVIAFLVCFPWGLQAQESASSVRGVLWAGLEQRSERDIGGSFGGQALTSFGLGAGYGPILGVLERSAFKESSGNSTLAVNREYEETLLWLFWRSAAWKGFVPYFGGGLGVYQDRVETLLMGSSLTSESPQFLLSGAALGVQWVLPSIWFSLEARIFSGEELRPPMMSGALLRLGFWL
jgi:hypothetical protein